MAISHMTKPQFEKLTVALLILLPLLVFGQVVQHDFINYDDGSYVFENPRVKEGWSIQGFAWALTTRFHLHWHPLTWLSHMTDCQLFGLNPGMHHLTSLFFHILNALLLFFLLNRLTGSHLQSAMVAALFALHPLHVEPVAWIADRKDLLSTFFMLLTLWAYAAYVSKSKMTSYHLAFACYIFALMSKSMAITIPFILLLLDYWPLKRFYPQKQAPAAVPKNSGKKKSGAKKNTGDKKNTPVAPAWRHLAVEKTLFFLPMIAGVILALLAIGFKTISAVSMQKLLPGVKHIGNAPISYVFYLKKMIWPINLAVPYPDLQMPSLSHAAGAFFILAGITILAFFRRRQNPYLLMGWLWYLITLLPVIGLVKSGPHIVADRYTYVPLIGLFIMIAWGIPDLLAGLRLRKQILTVSAISLILALSFVSWKMTGHWKNSLTIFAHSVNVTQNNHIAHNNLGIALLNQGKVNAAAYHFSRALEIKPGFAKAYNNLGLCLSKQGRLGEAVNQFSKAVQLDPKYEKAFYHLGNAYLKMGELKEAEKQFLKAVEIMPDFDNAHYNLAVVYTRQKMPEKAIFHYHQAISANPGNYKVRNGLGLLLLSQGKPGPAMDQFAQAIRIMPKEAKAYNNMGIALVKKGDTKQAHAYFSKAIEIDPTYSDARKNLDHLK